MPRKVDRFNVDGEDYAIEPIMDSVPTEGSGNAVASGGVYAELIGNRGDTSLQGSDGAFTRGGAYKYFAGASNDTGWLGMVFGTLLGRKWRVINDIPSGNYYGVTFGNGLFIAPSFHNSNTYWSDNGEDWHTCSLPSNDSVIDPMYANGVWAAGSTNKFLWSEDGKTWYNGTQGLTGTAYSPVYYNALWVAGSSDGHMYWSEDGKNWTASNSSLGTGIVSSPTYADGIWVCGSISGFYWSVDGKNWTAGTGTSEHVHTPAYNGSIWVATGTTGVLWSTDGKAWTGVTGISGYCYGPQYANGIWIVSNSGNSKFYKSEDGKVWAQISVLNGIQGTHVKYANGVWIIAGRDANQDACVLYSTDGNTWLSASFPISGAGVYAGLLSYAQGMWFVRYGIYICVSSVVDVLTSGYFNLNVSRNVW